MRNKLLYYINIIIQVVLKFQKATYIIIIITYNFVKFIILYNTHIISCMYKFESDLDILFDAFLTVILLCVSDIKLLSFVGGGQITILFPALLAVAK